MTVSVGSFEPDVYLVSSISINSEFNISFPFNDSDENIKVFIRKDDNTAQDLELDVDYYVTLSDGTNDVYGVVHIIQEYNNLFKLCIVRNVPISQDNAFSSQTIYADTTEKSLDKLTMILQDNQFKKYTIHAQDDEDIQETDLQLPPAAQRANKALYFDTNGAIVLGDGDTQTKSLRQSPGEISDPSFELAYNTRKSKMLGFDDQGHAKLTNYYSAGEHIAISDENVISTVGLATPYSAGDNIQISDQNVISATDTTYTAGTNVQISDQHVISATDTTYTAGTNVQISPQNVISATDTTYTAGHGISIDSNHVISTTAIPITELICDLNATGLPSSETLSQMLLVYPAEPSLGYNNPAYCALGMQGVYISSNGTTWRRSYDKTAERSLDDIMSIFRTCYVLSRSEQCIYSNSSLASIYDLWSAIDVSNLGFTVVGIAGGGQSSPILAYGNTSSYATYQNEWTTRTAPFSEGFVKVQYCNNMFIALGFASDANTTKPLQLSASTDGITWSTPITFENLDPTSISSIRVIGDATSNYNTAVVEIINSINFDVDRWIVSGATPNSITITHATYFDGRYLGYAFEKWWAAPRSGTSLKYTTDFDKYETDSFSLPARAYSACVDGNNLYLSLMNSQYTGHLYYKEANAMSIMAGNGLDVVDGALTLEKATSDNLGAVAVGNGLAVNNGLVSLDVVDNLITDSSTNALSAKMGKSLQDNKQDNLTAGTNIQISAQNVISATDTTYTAGTNVQISDQHVISATDTTYTAGNNVQISDQHVISATDTTYTAGSNIQISAQNEISATNTTYSAGYGISISNDKISTTVDHLQFYLASTANHSDRFMYSNGTYWTGCYNFVGDCSKSTDAKTWSTSNIGLSSYSQDIAMCNDIMYCTSDASSYVYCSDGTTWNSVSVGEGINKGQMAYGNSIYALAVKSSNKVIYGSSIDNLSNTATSISGRILTFMGSHFFMDVGRRGYTSSDCATWTQWEGLPDYNNYSVNAKSYINGYYVLYKNSNKTIYVSSDGVNWTSNTDLSDLGYIVNLADVNGTCVGVTADGSCVVASTDGTTWTRIQLPVTGTKAQLSTKQYGVIVPAQDCITYQTTQFITQNTNTLGVNESNLAIVAVKDGTTNLFRFFYSWNGFDWFESITRWKFTNAGPMQWCHDRWLCNMTASQGNGHPAVTNGIFMINFTDDWLGALV